MKLKSPRHASPWFPSGPKAEAPVPDTRGRQVGHGHGDIQPHTRGPGLRQQPHLLRTQGGVVWCSVGFSVTLSCALEGPNSTPACVFPLSPVTPHASPNMLPAQVDYWEQTLMQSACVKYVPVAANWLSLHAAPCCLLLFPPMQPLTSLRASPCRDSKQIQSHRGSVGHWGPRANPKRHRLRGASVRAAQHYMGASLATVPPPPHTHTQPSLTPAAAPHLRRFQERVLSIIENHDPSKGPLYLQYST